MTDKLPERQITKDDVYSPNVRVIGMLSPRRITTKEDLIEALHINEDEWEFVPEPVGKWDTMYTEKDGEGGKEPTVLEMYKVGGTLVRKKLLEVEYTVQPVRIAINDADSLKLRSNDALDYETQKTLAFFDPHFGFRRNLRTGVLDPFHDRAALSVILQVINEEQPGRIIIGGDLMDFSECSDKFIREPGFYFTTQAALEEAFWWLLQIRLACPNAEIDILKGNHDERLENIMMTHLMQITGLSVAGRGISSPPVMTLQYLLDFDTLGIKYVDDYPNGNIVIGGIEYIHGDTARAKPGNTSDKIATGATRDTIFGHIHRQEMVGANLANGKSIQVLCPGCTCRTDYTVPGHTRGQNWQQGFVIVNHSKKANEIHSYPINNGETMVNGSYYRYKSIISQLKKDTGWNF